MNSDSLFDRLPDELLLFIFSKLPDARSLTVCFSLSKRFSSLVPLTDTVFLAIPPPKPNPRASQWNLFPILRRRSFIAKSLQCFSCFTDSEPQEHEIASGFSTKDALKNFKGLKSLHIQCTSHITEIGADSFLKWIAEFGNELKRCFVLQAASFHRREVSIGEEQMPGQTLDEDELKIRVKSTISCLIFASVRHFVIKMIVADHPQLAEVVISDVKKEGELRMGKEDLSEIKSSGDSTFKFSLPEVSLRFWYIPVLELPESGWVLKGATLAVIGPCGGDGNGMTEAEKEKEICDEDELVSCFDGEGEGEEGKAFGEAVRKMMKMNMSCLITMSSS